VTSRNELIKRTQRMIEHVESHTTGQVPEIHRVPTADYSSPDRWQREVDEVFRRIPLAVALTAELPNVNDYKAVDVVGAPVVIQRGSDGTVRAFYNICRHRGAALANLGAGNTTQFVCPYHGWAFDQKGCLKAVPAAATFGEFDWSQAALTALPTEERHGIVWVILTPDIEMDLDDWLGPAQPVLAELELEKLHHFSTRQFDGPNWKVAMDGGLEVYHFPVLHRKTFNKTVHGNVAEVEALGRHQRIFFARRGIAALRAIPVGDWPVDEWLGQNLNVFPNIEIAFGFLPSNDQEKPRFGRHCLMHMRYPGRTVDTSVTYQLNLTSNPVLDEADRLLLENISQQAYDVVTGEDYWVGARIQRGLGYGAPRYLMFGRNEQALAHYHQQLDELLKER
jgi:phenylpropionate dioxygenase-like ring-hydroxylating dioxygenase large terminal subunit